MNRHLPRTGPRLRRRDAAALVLLALACSALLAPAQVATNMVANAPIALSTKTPLGTAQITLPAGAALENYEVLPDGRIRVWRGPFAAVVSPAEAAFPTPPPTPTPTPAPTPADQPAPTPEPDALLRLQKSLADGSLDWTTLAPTAAAALLGLYALVVTVAWLRQRRRTARALAAASKPALPAVLNASGTAVVCPHCGKEVPMTEKRQGRYSCPACHGAFICE